MRNLQCLLCSRFHGNDMLPTCDAFRKGIPADIWAGKFEHDKPFKWPNELLFKPVNEIVRSNNA